ncbi:MAG: DsbC family protein [Pseudomonadales bacterium]|nr:DsbC family protein [Pseudomonadales bacterium]NRA15304.1 DsbC family protein [Oceanospirillaceae bacterium]
MSDKGLSFTGQSQLLSKLLLALSLSISFSTAAVASVEQEITEKIKLINENIQIESVVVSPWPGMYEVTLISGEVIFSDKNAQYMVVGQMFQLSRENGFVNLSEQKNQLKVKAVLAAVPASEQIIYPAAGAEKAVITVFTDIDCYYCQKLHKNIPKLQASGVTIKYMAFPRAGVGSPVARQMESIWCSDDPAAALTIAKSKREVPKVECDNPVTAQFQLGHKLGVNATPTIFTEQGVKIAGFASVENLLADLGVKE